MKKFLFPANVIAVLILVPALVFGYLHYQAKAEKEATETAAEPLNHESSSIITLVKSF
ncbi:hypothetical protein [Sediminibacterium soli]|uniref:hypothetical protein n=1 Tax=Sediminibacterium soli TaxID=2698829 RepID=UPI0013799980|nr:hypothetical protein [Sediminibacterium soli]NCI47032.1 hypothetical protein [Sediminibacterium soli]